MSIPRKPHKAELMALSERELVNFLIQDHPHAVEFRKEGRRRAADVTTKSIFTPPNGSKRRTSEYPEDADHFYWRSDRVLAEDPNFTGVMEEFLEHAPSLWDDESKKTLEEVQSFLEGIIDRGLTYDDLSVPQKDWLGVIRRKHMDWVKSQGG